MEWFDTDTRVVAGIPFAVDSAGQWRDIDEVERGLKCGCFCAACNGPLVAKKGTQVIHHFAHHDRRECRHALEASLYGMVVEILTQPGAKIQLPGYIRRADWLWAAGIREGSRAYEAFMKSAWVIDPVTITAVNGLGVNAPSLQQSKVDVPEFVDESAKLEIHLLTYLKKLEDFAGLPVRDGWTRLGLNLRYYTSLWWSTCDVSRGENVTAAMQARDRLQQWLGEEPTGREFLLIRWKRFAKSNFNSGPRRQLLLSGRRRGRRRSFSENWPFNENRKSAVGLFLTSRNHRPRRRFGSRLIRSVCSESQICSPERLAFEKRPSETGWHFSESRGRRSPS